MVSYPTLINKLKKEELLLTEKKLRKNYKESVIVYCQVQNVFEIKGFEINFQCEIQDFSVSPAKIDTFICKEINNCQLKQ